MAGGWRFSQRLSVAQHLRIVRYAMVNASTWRLFVQVGGGNHHLISPSPVFYFEHRETLTMYQRFGVSILTTQHCAMTQSESLGAESAWRQGRYGAYSSTSAEVVFAPTRIKNDQCQLTGRRDRRLWNPSPSRTLPYWIDVVTSNAPIQRQAKYCDVMRDS